MISRRGQSNVVGVALLLGIAVVSMGALTAAVGVVVDSTASEANAERVAADFETVLEPIEVTGPNSGTITFGEGHLRAVERTLEIRADGVVVETVDVGALTFESGDRRVVYQSGAIVRSAGSSTWMSTPPSIIVDESVLVVSAATLGPDAGSVSGSGGVTVTVETDVSHERRDLGVATFSVALETQTPDAWERLFSERGATVEREAGDPPTVVATFDGDRRGYLVVHDLEAEVRAGG